MENYTFGERLGGGAFGNVFKGIYNCTGEKVAIKQLDRWTYIQNNIYFRAINEIDCMKKCECENSVKLLYYGEDQYNLYIVMELCDSDLDKLLKNNHKGFSIEEIREIFLELNNGFRTMRKKGIIHRDLKLENIMIKYSDKTKIKFIPKISDYGLGKVMTMAFNSEIASDPLYIAPELIQNKYYDEKVDLWSVGCIMYELYYNQKYRENYYPGKIKNILNNDFNNNNGINPKDQNFRDLLIKLLEENPYKRISWNEFFAHSFFVGNNQYNRYEIISDFDFGIKCDKNLLHCYIAKDNKYNIKVLFKSYNLDFVNNNRRIIDLEIYLFKCFSYNKNVLKMLKYFEENGRFNLVFEYREFKPLNNYIINQEITEKRIKKINKELYENVFTFIKSYNMMPFSFISIHSFGIDENDNILVLDFGFHKLLIPYEEYTSYFLSSKFEANNSLDYYKTNVLNYGIFLLKLYCADDIKLRDKEIILPNNKVFSEKFKNFLSKCLSRNIYKRYSWFTIGNDEFFLNNNYEMSNVIDNKVLLNNEKLETIFDSLKNKFEFIINYYKKLDISKNIEYIRQIEIFIIMTLFEMKIALNIFNRNIYEKPFTNQHEISFISINDDCEISKCCINLNNLLLKDVRIINMFNNKLINEFVSNLKNNIQNLEEISKKIHFYSKSLINNFNFKLFIKNILEYIDDESIPNYFFSIIVKADNEKNKSEKYNGLCLAEYFCEFLLFLKAFLFDKEEFNFDKVHILKKFYDIFNEDKNNIQISFIKIKEVKKKYVLVSFLSSLFKEYKLSIIKEDQNFKMDTQSLNGIIRYYLILMKKIFDLKMKNPI